MLDYILLPTGIPPHTGDLILRKEGTLEVSSIDYTYELEKVMEVQAYHLHQLGKRVIHDGDWGWLESVCSLFPYHMRGIMVNRDRKLLTSSDPTLNLPLIPKEVVKAFVEWYNAQGFTYGEYYQRVRANDPRP